MKKQQEKGEVSKRIKLFFHSVKKKLLAEKRKNPDISLLSSQDVGALHCILAHHLPLASQFTGSHRSEALEGAVDAFPSSMVQAHLYRQPQLGELE